MVGWVRFINKLQCDYEMQNIQFNVVKCGVEINCEIECGSLMCLKLKIFGLNL